jgi:hypothetical protein
MTHFLIDLPNLDSNEILASLDSALPLSLIAISASAIEPFPNSGHSIN